MGSVALLQVRLRRQHLLLLMWEEDSNQFL